MISAVHMTEMSLDNRFMGNVVQNAYEGEVLRMEDIQVLKQLSDEGRLIMAIGNQDKILNAEEMKKFALTHGITSITFDDGHYPKSNIWKTILGPIMIGRGIYDKALIQPVQRDQLDMIVPILRTPVRADTEEEKSVQDLSDSLRGDKQEDVSLLSRIYWGIASKVFGIRPNPGSLFNLWVRTKNDMLSVMEDEQGKEHQWVYYGEGIREYVSSFVDLGPRNNFPDWPIITELNSKKQNGQRVQLLDLFSPKGQFIPELKKENLIDDALSVGLSSGARENNQTDQDFVSGDLLDFWSSESPWKGISNWLQTKPKQTFDMIVCRPGGGFGGISGSYHNALYFLMLQKAWKLLDANNGVIYSQLPYNMDRESKQYIEQLKHTPGITVDVVYSSPWYNPFGLRWGVIRIVKHTDAPITLPKLQSETPSINITESLIDQEPNQGESGGEETLSEFPLDDTYHISVVSRFPDDVRNEIPVSYQQWAYEDNPQTRILLLQDENGKTYGFVSVIPDRVQGEWKLSMRFIVKQYRNQGLGAKLRDATYLWAIQNPDVSVINSGIDDVLRFSQDGSVVENTQLSTTGTWASYKSMINSTLPDGTYPEISLQYMKLEGSYSVKERVMYLGFGFNTKIRDANGNLLSSRVPTLPDSGEALFALAKELHVPQGMTIQQMFDEEESDMLFFDQKKTYGLDEYRAYKQGIQTSIGEEDSTGITQEESESTSVEREEVFSLDCLAMKLDKHVYAVESDEELVKSGSSCPLGWRSPIRALRGFLTDPEERLEIVRLVRFESAALGLHWIFRLINWISVQAFLHVPKFLPGYTESVEPVPFRSICPHTGLKPFDPKNQEQCDDPLFEYVPETGCCERKKGILKQCSNDGTMSIEFNVGASNTYSKKNPYQFYTKLHACAPGMTCVDGECPEVSDITCSGSAVAGYINPPIYGHIIPNKLMFAYPCNALLADSSNIVDVTANYYTQYTCSGDKRTVIHNQTGEVVRTCPSLTTCETREEKIIIGNSSRTQNISDCYYPQKICTPNELYPVSVASCERVCTADGTDYVKTVPEKCIDSFTYQRCMVDPATGEDVAVGFPFMTLSKTPCPYGCLHGMCVANTGDRCDVEGTTIVRNDGTCVLQCVNGHYENSPLCDHVYTYSQGYDTQYIDKALRKIPEYLLDDIRVAYLRTDKPLLDTLKGKNTAAGVALLWVSLSSDADYYTIIHEWMHEWAYYQTVKQDRPLSLVLIAFSTLITADGYAPVPLDYKNLVGCNYNIFTNQYTYKEEPVTGYSQLPADKLVCGEDFADSAEWYITQPCDLLKLSPVRYEYFKNMFTNPETGEVTEYIPEGGCN